MTLALSLARVALEKMIPPPIFVKCNKSVVSSNIDWTPIVKYMFKSVPDLKSNGKHATEIAGILRAQLDNYVHVA
jgi:hypothetical protein